MTSPYDSFRASGGSLLLSAAALLLATAPPSAAPANYTAFDTGPDHHEQTLNILNKISDLMRPDMDGKNFEKSLREIFECPVCYKVPKTEEEYEMCVRGHLVCRLCYLMTAYCPLCRETESIRKNRLVSRIMREIRKGYKCRYAEYGCLESCDILSTPRHEDECKFRHFSCLVEGCDWKGTIDEIQAHGLEYHQEFAAENNRIRFTEGKLQVRFGDEPSHPYWLLYDYTEEGFSMVVQSHVKTTADVSVKVTLGEQCGPKVTFRHPALHMADDPLTELLSRDHFEIPTYLISKYSHSTELAMTIIVKENKEKEFQWFSPFNIFTAAFVLQFFFFSMKQRAK